MRLQQPFLKLPKLFDADRVRAEIEALPAAAWVPHPGNYPGNDAVLLVTPGGVTTNGFIGQMAPTQHLRACPYIIDVMNDIGAVWGRSRLMGLAAGARVPPHVDVNYHWRTHLRIHIPIVTNPRVLFTSGGETVHMKEGECWVFNSFEMHDVHNGGAEKRIHLVLDTVGGAEMWDLLAAGMAGEEPTSPAAAADSDLARLRFEYAAMPKIMSPWEMRCHIAFLMDYANPDPRWDAVQATLDRFVASWTAAWAQFETRDEGLPVYRRLIEECQRGLAVTGAGLVLRNQVPIGRAVAELILQVACEATTIGDPAMRRLAS